MRSDDPAAQDLRRQARRDARLAVPWLLVGNLAVPIAAPDVFSFVVALLGSFLLWRGVAACLRGQFEHGLRRSGTGLLVFAAPVGMVALRGVLALGAGDVSGFALTGLLVALPAIPLTVGFRLLLRAASEHRRAWGVDAGHVLEDRAALLRERDELWRRRVEDDLS